MRSCSLPPGYVLVIAEKPKAASKIAEALAETGRAVMCRRYRVPYWIVSWRGAWYVVVPAAGHLFGLTTKEKGFPVFNYYWAPLWEIDEGAKHTRYFFETIKFLARRALRFVNACDYDIEGSVIGYIILKMLNATNRALRAKFSALTRSDIRRAFTRLTPLDWDMINAGLARHELDWIWGINVSRALMESVRLVTGKRIVLSAGRVQSPTLLEAVEKSMQRRLHVPIPFFTVKVQVEVDGRRKTLTVYRSDVLKDAEKVAARVRQARFFRVVAVDKRVERVNPPFPFNLGDLQAEASRIYGYSPYYTQKLAEDLYLDGLISYPRTNSQQIPPTVDVVGILRSLARQPSYSKLVKLVIEETRGAPRVNNGPKTDPAHPAIHPTGERPVGLDKHHQRIYDLIVRRFLASMMPPAVVAKARYQLTLLGDSSIRLSLTSTIIVRESWFSIYPWLKPGEESYELQRGQLVPIRGASVVTEFTPPPKPHTKASLVRWMEAKGIGTEATRARIVELLFERKYLTSIGGYVYSTELGDTIALILREFFPKITSVELTREFEEKLEAIRSGKLRRETVVEEAKRLIARIIEEFKRSYMEKAGLEIAYSLKLKEPPRKCPICGRPAVSGSMLCRYHELALRALREGYREWKRRMGVDCREFLVKLSGMKTAGVFVRDVASYLLSNSSLASLVCRE